MKYYFTRDNKKSTAAYECCLWAGKPKLIGNRYMGTICVCTYSLKLFKKLFPFVNLKYGEIIEVNITKKKNT